MTLECKLLLALIPLTLFVVLIIIRRVQNQIKHNYLKVLALVVNADKFKDVYETREFMHYSMEIDTGYHITYKYNVNGKEYICKKTFRRSPDMKSPHKEDSEVTLYVNPVDPFQTIDMKSFKIAYIALIPMTIAFTLGIISIFIFV